MTEADLEKLIAKMIDRLDGINLLYIRKIAAQLLKIGTLSQTNVNRLISMAEMNADIAEINQRLMIATALNVRDLKTVYRGILANAYTDKRFTAFLSEKPISQEAKARLEAFVQNVYTQTAGTMRNLSNTTLASETYRKVVDDAILKTSLGMDGYKTATREAIKELGRGGMQVRYPSGYHRRLDSSVRQNIIDGTNQSAQHASLEIGKELGFDAVELSAHARSAPDHEPIQGHIFMRDQFETLQAGGVFSDIQGRKFGPIRRPIGEWNCMHIAMAFSTAHSIPRYTDQELKAFINANHAGCEIGGKKYTIYECVQLMRNIETEVRLQKDIAVGAQEAQNDVLRQECQVKINRLAQRYMVIAKAAGITPRKDRMAVEGFRAIKVR